MKDKLGDRLNLLKERAGGLKEGLGGLKLGGLKLYQALASTKVERELIGLDQQAWLPMLA